MSDAYTKLHPPRYFTSGSPKICGKACPNIIVVGPIGNWPPSTKVAPPSSEYMKPDSDTVLAKPRKSLNAITTCCPLLSVAMEVSDCVEDGPASLSHSGSLMQRLPDTAVPNSTDAVLSFASFPIADISGVRDVVAASAT